jgi:hypothetical protein
LRGYRLRLHKRGRDGSAKCDAWWSGARADVVYGAVYRIARKDLRALDHAEDLGRGYDRVGVWVFAGTRRLRAYTYLARPESMVQGLLPFDWYLQYMLHGARHHGLPQAYVSRIERMASRRDENGARRRLNQGVLLRSAPPYRRR